MRSPILLALPLLCLAAEPARAADPSAAPSPERAAAAEDAIRDFVKGMLGPAVPVGDKPVHLRPDGDHYDATATLAPGQVVTAAVREGAAGVWTFDTLRYPNPAHFTIEIPAVAGKPGDPKAQPSRLTYDIKAAQQDGAGAIDTTLATPSSMTASLRALDMALTGTDQSSNTHMGTQSSTSTLRAGSAPGTVDLLAASTMADYAIVASAQTPALAVNVRLDADSAEGRMEVNGIARDKGMALLRSAVSVIASDYASRANPAKPFDPAPAHALVQAMDGFATSLAMVNAATRVRGVLNGVPFGLERMRVGFDGQSPGGTMALGMEMELDGLTLPTVAGTPMAAFIPSKVEFHPTVSGVNTHDFLAALAIATDPARPKDAGPPPEFFALLRSPGLAAGIDSLEVDLGTSVLTGSGKVTMPAPERLAGAGQVAVTGFDALTDRVKALPEANQVLPALLFAKGIGRTDGARLVWDITYDGTRLLVNGVDVLAMAGGGRR